MVIPPMEIITATFLEFFIMKYKLSWGKFSSNLFSPLTIEKNKNKLDWKKLSELFFPTQSLIEKYTNQINFDHLSKNERLTPQLIRKYSNKLNWDNLSKNKCFPVEIIDEFIQKINWFEFGYVIPQSLIEKYKTKLKSYHICKKIKITQTTLGEYNSLDGWIDLSLNESLSIEMVEQNLDKVDWYNLSFNPILTQTFIEKYSNQLNWTNLSFNSCLSEDMIEKYKDKLDWYCINKNKSLTLKNIMNNQEKINWMDFSRNLGKLTPYAINKYSNKIFFDNTTINKSSQYFHIFIEIVTSCNFATNFAEDRIFSNY